MFKIIHHIKSATKIFINKIIYLKINNKTIFNKTIFKISNINNNPLTFKIKILKKNYFKN